MQFGIVDLGTNSVRLFVYRQHESGELKLQLKRKEMVRLGDSVYETGKLNPLAIERTLDALQAFQDILERKKIDVVQAVATSAARCAKDGKDFCKLVRKKIGMDLRVISGKEEARLIAQGVTSNVKLGKDPVLLLDIGGGSTELSFCKGKKILQSASLKIGAASGQQLFLKKVPPRKSALIALEERVRELIDEKVPESPLDSIKYVLGSSGSIRAFNRILHGPAKTGSRFSRDELKSILKTLKKAEREEILLIPGIEARRADLITSAGVILKTFLDVYGIKKVRSTRFALKDGLLAEMLQQDEA